MGVCYYVRAGNDTYTDHGYLEISVGCDTARVKEVITVILTECKRLSTEMVSDEELKKVKEYMVGNMLLELESSDAYTYFYGGQAILRRTLRSPKEVEKKIRAVKAEEIRKVAKQVFVPSSLNLALIGPFTQKDEKEFTDLLSFIETL